MNSDLIFNIVVSTIRRRWRRVVLTCLLLYPLAVIALRIMDFSYTAQIRMFALPQSSHSLLDPAGGLFLGSSGMERDNLLLGQEALIKSNRVFEKAKLKDPDLVKKEITLNNGRYLFNRAVGVFQEIIFGSQYVETRQRWKDKEFSLFKKRIGVDVNREAASIAVIYRHQNPEVAIKTVRAAADALQEINVEISKNQAAKRVLFLEGKIADARRENDKISDEMTAFSRKNRISSDPRSVEPRFKGLLGARELVDSANLEIAQREVTLKEARSVSDRIRSEIKKGLIDDREGRLTNLTSELRRYDLGMSKNVGNSSKVSAAVKKQISVVRKKIEEELSSGGSQMDVASLQNLLTTNEASVLEQENALRAAKKQLEFGEAQARKYDRELAALPELDAQLAKLTIVQSQQRKILEQLTQKYLEAQIESDTKLDQFYVTEEPSLIDSERTGKLPMLLSLILLITVLVVSSFVGMDIYSGVILNKQQLVNFQIPQFIGAIPFLPSFRSRRPFAIVTESGLGFRVAHAIKKFLVNENRTGQANVVAVTSKGAKVGKTVTTVGIASAAQVGGARVLLIDADYLAKERALRVQFSEGINDLQSVNQVRELASSFSALQKRQKINVWTLANEFMDESALTSFLVNDFGKVLEELRFSFDLIVVDCAPCFISSMLLIYEQADVNILCFAEGYSTLQDVEQLTEVVLPATKNGSAVFSVLTMAQLKNNVVSPRGSDGVYYRTVRAA